MSVLRKELQHDRLSEKAFFRSLAPKEIDGQQIFDKQ